MEDLEEDVDYGDRPEEAPDLDQEVEDLPGEVVVLDKLLLVNQLDGDGAT